MGGDAYRNAIGNSRDFPRLPESSRQLRLADWRVPDISRQDLWDVGDSRLSPGVPGNSHLFPAARFSVGRQLEHLAPRGSRVAEMSWQGTYMVELGKTPRPPPLLEILPRKVDASGWQAALTGNEAAPRHQGTVLRLK